MGVFTEVPDEGLSPVEQALVDHVRRGAWLDLAAGEVVDEASMRSWGDARTCRASVIRDILLGRLATHADPHGLRLRGARISGILDLESLATDVRLELSDCLLEEGVLATEARLAYLGLPGCRIQRRAEPPPDVPPVDAARLAEAGAIDLSCAQITGQLDFTGACLRNDAGPALTADGLQVGLDVFLSDGFTATGSGKNGTVRLIGAHIAGQFYLAGATLHNDSGAALHADDLQVDQNMYLSDGFTAAGSGKDGTVRLPGAHIGGQLDCAGATLRNGSGPALVADSLQVDQSMFLTGGFTATGSGSDDVVINLQVARINGTLVFAPACLAHKTDARRRLETDGLTYAGVPQGVPAREWLQLLRDGTPRYAAQPYQQLAGGYRALGDDRLVRQILMTQRDDQLARADTSWPDRVWGRITRITLGYGYQPWRALLFLAGVLALSCVLAAVLGSHGALAQVTGTAVTNHPCTRVQKVSVGLDLNLPVGTTLARAGCGLAGNPASATAAWLAVSGWALRLLAWAFAVLFVAGFTSAVRKT